MPRKRSRVADIFTLLARNHTARAFKAHIRNSPAPPRITLYYNSSFFRRIFCSFYFFSADLAADRTHRTVQYTTTPLLCPHAARQTRSLAVLTRIIAPLCGDIPPQRAFRGLFARLPPSPRQLLPLTLPLDTPFASFGSLYSRKRCRGAHFIMFSFHVEHTSCHSPKPQHLSRFLLVYAYLYIASLHVFRLSVCFFRPCDPFPVVAPRLTITPRRRSAAFVSEPLVAARACRFRRRSFAFLFSRQRLPLFVFSISFCLMLRGAPLTSFCLFFSAFGFSRFPFDDPLRIFARL